MANIFTKQVYVEKIYLTFRLKPTMRKLEKNNGLEMLEISVLFSYRKLMSNCWYYLTVSLDKISNKKIISKMMNFFSFI